MKSRPAPSLLIVLLLAACVPLSAAESPAPAQPAESAMNSRCAGRPVVFVGSPAGHDFDIESAENVKLRVNGETKTIMPGRL